MVNNEIENIKGIGPKAAKTLVDCGFNTVEKLANATADELAQLPGIGKATAESMILSAKELVVPAKPVVKTLAKKPPTKTTTTKTEVEPKIKDLDKDTIPKPPVLKSPEEKVAVRPSVKEPKAPAKKPPAKPAAKAPAKKLDTIKKDISDAAKLAIAKAPSMPKIKPKTSSKKAKPKKKVSLSKTFGIVHSVLHDASGKSKNRAVILYLHNMELPISSYLGRKVNVVLPRTNKQMTGTISRVHGKSESRNNAVIVRFQKGVSPHIITARATFK
ncbi:MAG: hypothetical protein KGD64_09455 [Candidatus Heimdallarchaeota archaeon]|nr:hypothetical protein [Candidatus Heimdallarchaeota archaeon]